MCFINSFSFLFLLLVSLVCLANSLQNDSSISLKRTRRLSDGIINEETHRLAKYMVSLRTRGTRYFYGETHFCGGVIIAPRFVLTSAHCLVNRRTRVLYSHYILLVVAGTPDRLKYRSGISFHSAVQQIFVPDNFTLHNEQDVGVILLKTSIPRNNKYIAIARLPYRPIELGTMCMVLGWGRIFKNGPLSARITHITIKIVSPQECVEILGVDKYDMLCGMDETRDTAQNPCTGDRGAPLMKDNIVYGIVGVLVECAAFKLPSVYTDVQKSIGWIRRVMIQGDGHVCHVSLALFYGAILFNLLLTNQL